MHITMISFHQVLNRETFGAGLKDEFRGSGADFPANSYIQKISKAIAFFFKLSTLSKNLPIKKSHTVAIRSH